MLIHYKMYYLLEIFTSLFIVFKLTYKIFIFYCSVVFSNLCCECDHKFYANILFFILVYLLDQKLEILKLFNKFNTILF